MPAAVVPRQLSIAAWVAKIERRVRRLEINHDWPAAGTAIYTETYSGSAGTSWTPDFTGATAYVDDIGLTLNGGGIEIPQGWLAVVNAGFTIAKSSAPPTGEAVVWSLAAGNGAGEVNRQDVMTNVTNQALAATVPAPSGWAASVPLPVVLGAIETILGTEFTPVSAIFSVWAIQLPTAGWPPGGII